MGKPILRLSKVRTVYHFSPPKEGYILSFMEKPMAYLRGCQRKMQSCGWLYGGKLYSTKVTNFMWTEDDLT